MRIKLMTYNIAAGRDYSRYPKVSFSPDSCAGVISDLNADIVGLNEVDRGIPRSDFINLTGYLADRLGYTGVFAPAIHFCGGLYGNAFLSRLPVLSSQIIPIPDPKNVFPGVHIESRCVLRNILKTDSGELCVLVTHFGLSKAERESAVSTLTGIIDGESRPVVLMGDFNLERDDKTLQPILQRLKNAGDSLPRGAFSFPSYPCAESKAMIDFILTSEQITVSDVCVHDICKSDHRPMTAEISIP